MNAKENIYTKHQDANGVVDWRGVAGENDNYHDHWVDGIGHEIISDFSGQGGEGDSLLITGHTVTYEVLEETNDKIVLGLYSDQGADGSRGNGAHDFDVLGVLEVNHDGNFNVNNDLTVQAGVFHGSF